MTDAHTEVLRAQGRRGGLADGERRRSEFQEQIVGLGPLQIHRRGYQSGYQVGYRAGRHAEAKAKARRLALTGAEGRG